MKPRAFSMIFDIDNMQLGVRERRLETRRAPVRRSSNGQSRRPVTRPAKIRASSI